MGGSCGRASGFCGLSCFGMAEAPNRENGNAIAGMATETKLKLEHLGNTANRSHNALDAANGVFAVASDRNVSLFSLVGQERPSLPALVPRTRVTPHLRPLPPPRLGPPSALQSPHLRRHQRYRQDLVPLSSPLHHLLVLAFA
ncbi:hypothetical protein HK096_005823 [Nowakowskiella sp. JEL0078]|nr:hypothetical protein HK096_005823 [Nowakowskiella sp. JEL0078]